MVIKSEDRLTLEVFSQLSSLLYHPEVFQALFRFLLDTDPEDGEKFQGLAVRDENGPDVVITTSSRQVVIEVKLGSSFTEQQLQRYVSSFPESPVIALGKSLRKPPQVARVPDVAYRSWPDFRKAVLELTHRLADLGGGNPPTAAALAGLAMTIQDRVGLFSGFPDIQIEGDSIQPAFEAAGAFFGGISDWAGSNDCKIERWGTSIRPRVQPAFDSVFGIRMTARSGQSRALLVQLSLGTPWRLRLGMRIQKPQGFKDEGKREKYLALATEKAQKSHSLKAALRSEAFGEAVVSVVAIDDDHGFGGTLNESFDPDEAYPALSIELPVETGDLHQLDAVQDVLGVLKTLAGSVLRDLYKGKVRPKRAANSSR